MVFEGRIADMLQNQASRFLRGFTAEQIRLGLLKGRIEVQGLALNPEPLDSLFMESEIPLVMKAGVLSSAVAQVSILQGELELTIDGILLVLCPTCRWLARDEVFSHRLNEIQRLEFVHMRSQCQRRTLEHEMFRQLFQDYLSRLKITVKNVHVRIELEGEVFAPDSGAATTAVVGMVLNSCAVIPMKSAVQAAADEREKAQNQNGATPPGELLLSERVNIKGFSLYHEMPETANLHVPWAMYEATKDEALGVFHQLKQEQFVRLMTASRRHTSAPAMEQLMPPTNFAITLDLKSTLVRDGFHVDSCLVMEIGVKLEGTPSRLHFSDGVLEHLQLFVNRTLDFQLWQFLHPSMQPPSRSGSRGRLKAIAQWGILRRFIALRRRIHSNSYCLEEAITMRIHCKEYVRLYKKKFNGPASVVGWRRGLPALTNQDAARLSNIELLYPADKLVNFRLMAHAELKTEMALNNFLNVDEGSDSLPGDTGAFRRIARELTPLEQLHLHGQHGYGVNIYRGLPPPPSSLKIRIEIQAPEGLWWVCQFGKAAKTASAKALDTSGWVVAVDCAAQPVRVLLVDSVVDTSVFTTIEAPPAPPNERPLALLLGRTAAAFEHGSPSRRGKHPVSCGGLGDKEWLSLLEMDGHFCLCGQLKTLLTSSPNSPWDIFMHMSCGEAVDPSVHNAPRGRMPMVGVPPGPPGGQSNGRVRVCLPFRMPSGQSGPLTSMLRRAVASAAQPVPGVKRPKGTEPQRQVMRHGPAYSAIAWLAKLVSGTRDIAMLRASVRLPPVTMQVPVQTGELSTHTQLPRFDAACHFEHGGLVDGYVVGLHSLRHFVASILAPAVLPERSPGGGGQSLIRAGNTSITWPLRPLEQAPPLGVIMSALSLAFAVVLASGTEPTDSGAVMSLDATLVSMLRSSQLMDLWHHEVPADGDADPPASAVTLTLVMIGVMVGRRTIWDLRDSKEGLSSRDPNADTPEARAAASGLTEVYRLVGAMLRVLLLMGFPLHPRCLPVAAWAGALEILQAAAASVDAGGSKQGQGQGRSPTASWSRQGLILWAARGALANLHSRQDEVVRWLLRQGGRIDEVDAAGRTLMDWACWSGCEGLTSLALRAGLLTFRSTGSSMHTESSNDSSNASARSPRPPALSPLPVPPSPLTLAVASRCPSVISMMLRTGGDPHSPPRGGSCGPLLLAVRNCEFELALQVLQGSPFVSVEAALGASVSTTTGLPGSSVLMKGDGDGGLQVLGCKVRATVTLVDSIRRFAAALPRRTEEVSPLCTTNALRSAVPGSHPDEGVFAPTHIPFVDILHPVMEQLPPPAHKVTPDQQVRPQPLAWLSRKSEDPWQPVYRFIECCILLGFRPDVAVVGRALPALSADARRAVQHMLFTGTGPLSTGSPHQDAAALSFAKEIRDLRAHMPGAGSNADLVSALGASYEVAGRSPTSMTHTDSNGSSIRGRSAYIQAPAGAPTVWVAVSFGSGTIAAGPCPVDFLRVDGNQLAWKLRSTASNGNSNKLQTTIRLDDIGGFRRIEQKNAQGGAMTSLHIIEMRFMSEADIGNVLKSIRGSDDSDAGRGTNGHRSHNDMQGKNGDVPILSIMFSQSQDADQLVDAMPGEGRHNDRDDANADPALSALLQEPPQGKLEVARAAAQYLQRGLWQVPKETGGAQASGSADVQHLIRVVVLGAPHVGKTRTVAGLLAELAASPSGAGQDSGCPWLKVSSGYWPAKGRPAAEVHIWDTSAAPQPGLLSWFMDAAVPSVVVVVSDAANPVTRAPADQLLTACVEKAVSANGSIRVLAVDNLFPGFSSSSSSRDAIEKMTTFSGARVCSVARCSLQSPEDMAVLQKAFSKTLKELIREAEAHPMLLPPSPSRSGRAAQSPQAAQSKATPFGAVIMQPASLTTLLGMSVETGKDRRLLGSRLRGDSAWLDPAAISWAWAAVCASQGYLLEGSSSSGSALVLWERLENVLLTADGIDKSYFGEEHRGSDIAHVLLSALTNLGLVCPIPAVSTDVQATSSTALTCTWVLIPDFARRVRLTPSLTARLQEATAGRGSSGVTSWNGTGQSSSAAPAPSKSLPISARLVWEHGAVPSLRSALRDFLARGTLGGGNARTPSRSLEARRFLLLEAGPTGPANANGASSNGLEPGFLLTFDFAQAAAHDVSHEDATLAPDGPAGNCTPKPPASVTAMSPSGLVQDPARHAAHSSSGRALDDDFGITSSSAGSSSRPTAIIVGTSTQKDKAFWDIHCSGPHAQWAWRALIGEGGAGPAESNFVALSRSARAKAPEISGAAAEHAWPLPPPPCVVSAAAASSRGSLGERPTGQEFFGLGWLFNAPQAAPVREALLPSQSQEESGSFAACCAALCGKLTEPNDDIVGSFEDDGSIAGLASCADFEASFLARSWKMAPRFLDEALAASPEAWSLCSVALVRVVHDTAAAVAGIRGRALPLLHADVGGSSGSKVVALVPEGPTPLEVPAAAGSGQPTVLGPLRSCAGVEAWLRLCKPAALWSAAGIEYGYSIAARQPQAAPVGSVGAQVVEALRSAMSVRLTEQMISEVWDALNEAGAANVLVRRAGGTWTQVNGSVLLL